MFETLKVGICYTSADFISIKTCIRVGRVSLRLLSKVLKIINVLLFVSVPTVKAST